jgi:hypothetical protein
VAGLRARGIIPVVRGAAAFYSVGIADGPTQPFHQLALKVL